MNKTSSLILCSLIVCVSVLGCTSTPPTTPDTPVLASASRLPGARTSGVDHVGLAVPDLAKTQAFFTDALGFKLLGVNPTYPAAFLTDGVTIITLWQLTSPENATKFNRKNNTGLHHLAFKLQTLDELQSMYAIVKAWPGVSIEFAPELLGKGPSQHMMFYEPGGVRLEFIVRLR